MIQILFPAVCTAGEKYRTSA